MAFPSKKYVVTTRSFDLHIYHLNFVILCSDDFHYFIIIMQKGEIFTIFVLILVILLAGLHIASNYALI